MGKEREYTPCMSACPKTCSNYNMYDRIKNNCQFACVEGCGCGDGMVMALALNYQDLIVQRTSLTRCVVYCHLVLVFSFSSYYTAIYTKSNIFLINSLNSTTGTILFQN